MTATEGGNQARGGRLAPGKKEDLLSLVGYQSGSVVSRVILDLGVGTVTLFAFDEGEGLSEHTSPYDALVHVLEGEAHITIAGEETDLKESEAVVLPAGKPHAVAAKKKFKMLLTMIRRQ